MRKQRPDEDVVYIDEQDRLGIEKRMKEKGISKAELARQCSVTGAAITLLLKPILKGETRACRFMSRLQRVLGLAPTTKTPAVLSRDIQRKMQQIAKNLQDDPDALDNWLKQGDLLSRRGR